MSISNIKKTYKIKNVLLLSLAFAMIFAIGLVSKLFVRNGDKTAKEGSSFAIDVAKADVPASSSGGGYSGCGGCGGGGGSSGAGSSSCTCCCP